MESLSKGEAPTSNQDSQVPMPTMKPLFTPIFPSVTCSLHFPRHLALGSIEMWKNEWEGMGRAVSLRDKGTVVAFD